jgi:hypothetical protein
MILHPTLFIRSQAHDPLGRQLFYSYKNHLPTLSEYHSDSLFISLSVDVNQHLGLLKFQLLKSLSRTVSWRELGEKLP